MAPLEFLDESNLEFVAVDEPGLCGIMIDKGSRPSCASCGRKKIPKRLLVDAPPDANAYGWFWFCNNEECSEGPRRISDLKG